MVLKIALATVFLMAVMAATVPTAAADDDPTVGPCDFDVEPINAAGEGIVPIDSDGDVVSNYYVTIYVLNPLGDVPVIAVHAYYDCPHGQEIVQQCLEFTPLLDEFTLCLG